MTKVLSKKSFIIVCLIISMIISLVGCSNNKGDNSNGWGSNIFESSEVTQKYSSGLSFELSSSAEYYIVTGFGDCTDTEVIIPFEYNSKPVAAVGKNAFAGSERKSIVLPDSIQYIGDYAFSKCIKITSINLPSKLISIGRYAFNECESLERIILPDGLTEIEEGTFKYCKNLKEIIIPNNVTSIGSDVFVGCLSLESITLPETITDFGEDIFYGCKNLKSVTFPIGVERISGSMCMSCEALETIYLPQTVTYISGAAFRECPNLNTVYFDGSMSQFNSITFYMYLYDDFDWLSYADIVCTGQEEQPIETDETIIKVNDYINTLSSNYNFNGETFTYLGSGNEAPDVNEVTGNITSDALYYRQRELEDAFGITFDNRIAAYEGNRPSVNPTVELVIQDVMAGLGSYDLIYGYLPTTLSHLLNQGCLANISNFGSVNLKNDWWPATLEETLSIGGKLYFLTGPIMTSYYGDGSCLLFNKAVAEDYGIETPYESVLDGTWTFDKMFEVASAIPPNTTGTGTYRYGSPDGLSTLFANGITITKFDDAGIPFVEASPPAELVDLAGKFSVIMGDESQAAITKYSGSTYEHTDEKYGYESFADMFADGEFLFFFATTDTASGLREKDVEFGILPLPKASVDQSQYYSYANNWGARYCAVPKSTRDLETTDVVLEVMAALSLKHIRPAFYDKLLKGRSTHDTDSKEMLDIIFDTKIYDIVDIYSLGDQNQSGAFVKGIEKAIEFDDSSLSSVYRVSAVMANKNIEKIMTNISR